MSFDLYATIRAALADSGAADPHIGTLAATLAHLSGVTP